MPTWESRNRQRTAREAALLALREVFTGEVAVNVTTPDNRTAEVNVTM